MIFGMKALDPLIITPSQHPAKFKRIKLVFFSSSSIPDGIWSDLLTGSVLPSPITASDAFMSLICSHPESRENFLEDSN